MLKSYNFSSGINVFIMLRIWFGGFTNQKEMKGFFFLLRSFKLKNKRFLCGTVVKKKQALTFTKKSDWTPNAKCVWLHLNKKNGSIFSPTAWLKLHDVRRMSWSKCDQSLQGALPQTRRHAAKRWAIKPACRALPWSQRASGCLIEV